MVKLYDTDIKSLVNLFLDTSNVHFPSSLDPLSIIFLKKWEFFVFFIFYYDIQHCFIRHLSAFNESEDVGIETRTFVTMAMAVRWSNYIIYLAPETGSEAGVMTGSEAGVMTGSKAGVVTGSEAGVVTGSEAGVLPETENQQQQRTRDRGGRLLLFQVNKYQIRTF